MHGWSHVMDTLTYTPSLVVRVYQTCTRRQPFTSLANATWLLALTFAYLPAISSSITVKKNLTSSQVTLNHED